MPVSIGQLQSQPRSGQMPYVDPEILQQLDMGVPAAMAIARPSQGGPAPPPQLRRPAAGGAPAAPGGGMTPAIWQAGQLTQPAMPLGSPAALAASQSPPLPRPSPGGLGGFEQNPGYQMLLRTLGNAGQLPTLDQFTTSYVYTPVGNSGYYRQLPSGPTYRGMTIPQYLQMLQGFLNGPEGFTQAENRLGQLGLQAMELGGIPGVAPGRLQTQANQVAQAGLGQEMQYGRDAQYSAFWNQERQRMINSGMAPDQVNTEMARQGFQSPAFLGGPTQGRLPGQQPPVGAPATPPAAAGPGAAGPGAAGPGAAGPATPAGAESPEAVLSRLRSRILSNQEYGTFEQTPNGVAASRVLRQGLPDSVRRQAITSFLGAPELTPEFLTSNLDQVRGAAQNLFGVPATEQWFSQSFYPWGDSVIPGLGSDAGTVSAQRSAIDRILAAGRARGDQGARMQRGGAMPGALAAPGAAIGATGGGMVGSAIAPGPGTYAGGAAGAAGGAAAGGALGALYRSILNSQPANAMLDPLGL